MNATQTRNAIMLWVLLTFLITMSGLEWWGGHITFWKLLIELVAYGLMSYGFVRLIDTIKKNPSTPRPRHALLRILGYLGIMIAMLLVGITRGFSFAWDPNTSFQFAGFGQGWESTAGLGLLVGLGAGILIVFILEYLRRQEKDREKMKDESHS